MKSTITITPITNIKDSALIDDKIVEVRTYDSDKDMFKLYNVLRKQNRIDNLMNISLYNDLIVEGEIQYKVLAMLSK